MISVLLIVALASAAGASLGRLRWCDTLCLCEGDEVRHCFSEGDIFGLLRVEERTVMRLQRAKFQLEQRLMWCSDLCLCHKKGRKNFKCADEAALQEFVQIRAPELYPLIGPEQNEIPDSDVKTEKTWKPVTVGVTHPAEPDALDEDGKSREVLHAEVVQLKINLQHLKIMLFATVALAVLALFG